MADPTLEQLTAKRDAMQAAYDDIILGKGVQSVTYADGGITYTAANAGKLADRISQLNTQIDRMCGRRGGGFGVLTG